MDFISHIQSLAEERGLTNADISRLSGVPEQTVKRILNGTTPDPRFDSIAKITIALGGSLDVISGLRGEAEYKPSSPVKKALSASADLIGEKEAHILELKDALKRERRAKNIILCVAAAFIGVMLLLLMFLVFDVLHGNCVMLHH